MVNANKKIEQFLEMNKGIIIKIARKRLGPHFNEMEAMSIAYLAGLQAKVYKRDQFQKTKDTTVFVWYLKKGFESIRGLDGGEISSQRNWPACNEELRDIDFERTVFKPGETDGRGHDRDVSWKKYEMESVSREKNEFHVCIKSFNDKAVSKRVLDTLRLLTRQHYCKPAINELEKMYGCRRKTTLSNKIFKQLVSEINAMGLKLFKAECMNAIHSTVIACAETREEADSYFTDYGKVLKCSQLVMPNDTK